jgi:hypothetical protein
LLLLPSLLLLGACSFATEFVVINESGKPVEVWYAFKANSVGELRRGSCCFVPAKKRLGEVDDLKAEWRALARDQYRYDEEWNSVTVVPEPGEALRVEDIINYGGHGSKTDELRFDIASIRLTGARGVAQYEGAQAQMQFAKKSAQIYAIRYH